MARLLATPRARTRTGVAFIVAAVLLAAWSVYLGNSLPPGPHHAWSTAWSGLDHLALMWVGVDSVECLALLTIGTAMLANRPLVVAVTALIALPVFAIDAWFDVMTSQTHSELVEAVILAVFAELPLVVLLALIARHELARVVTAASRADPTPAPAPAPAPTQTRVVAHDPAVGHDA